MSEKMGLRKAREENRNTGRQKSESIEIAIDMAHDGWIESGLDGRGVNMWDDDDDVSYDY